MSDEKAMETIKTIKCSGDEQVVNAMCNAYEALRRRVPQWVEVDGYPFEVWYCPNCHTEYDMDTDEYHYCPACGQALKWRD